MIVNILFYLARHYINVKIKQLFHVKFIQCRNINVQVHPVLTEEVLINILKIYIMIISSKLDDVSGTITFLVCWALSLWLKIILMRVTKKPSELWLFDLKNITNAIKKKFNEKYTVSLSGHLVILLSCQQCWHLAWCISNIVLWGSLTFLEIASNYQFLQTDAKFR